VKHGVAETTRLLASLVIVLLFILSDACVKRVHNVNSIERNRTTQSQSQLLNEASKQSARININTASADELETLPGIGKALAERVIEQREKYGPFRRPEHLIIVRGISDKRFRALQDLITVD
jgi:competence ComEA-like helix-hairpin-helix protein